MSHPSCMSKISNRWFRSIRSDKGCEKIVTNPLLKINEKIFNAVDVSHPHVLTKLFALGARIHKRSSGDH